VNAALIAAAVAVSALGAGCDSSGPSTATTMSPGALDANATIGYIVDGDTVDVILDGREERIRLIGIDTPETKQRDTPIECFGPEATAFIESLLPIGTPVRIERDTVNRDDYGRLLGYVFRADDGIFVNYEIVRQGFAQPLTIEPNTTHAALFVDASRAAERDDIGLWSACAG
jgi:micrococcal nuclease